MKQSTPSPKQPSCTRYCKFVSVPDSMDVIGRSTFHCPPQVIGLLCNVIGLTIVIPGGSCPYTLLYLGGFLYTFYCLSDLFPPDIYVISTYNVESTAPPAPPPAATTPSRFPPPLQAGGRVSYSSFSIAASMRHILF